MDARAALQALAALVSWVDRRDPTVDTCVFFDNDPGGAVRAEVAVAPRLPA